MVIIIMIIIADENSGEEILPTSDTSKKPVKSGQNRKQAHKQKQA